MLNSCARQAKWKPCAKLIGSRAGLLSLFHMTCAHRSLPSVLLLKVCLTEEESSPHGNKSNCFKTSQVRPVDWAGWLTSCLTSHALRPERFRSIVTGPNFLH